MTGDIGTNRRGTFVTCLLPWLLGGGMFALYLLTLCHSATPVNLERLADLSGWDWRPRLYPPLTWLITEPIGWLPENLRLGAVNLFSAVCAALTLTLLARSVALLPHDRTNEERQREHSEHSLLTIPVAWLPPLFAVLLLGLQMGFWQRAVQYWDQSFLDNCEIFNLLIFAYVLRCLLEYRVSEKEPWLTRFALACGAGMANNWAMYGFLPLFLAALIWVKGFDFFHWRFVVRMTVCGLAGLCLILLQPLVIQFQHHPGIGFWQALHESLSSDKAALLHAIDRKWLLLFGFTSFLPVILIGIRWASSFGDNSRVGIFFANTVFNAAYGFLLLSCVWIAFDPPVNPRIKYPDIPFLTFAYLGALSVGYFSGYFLLVFGVSASSNRQRTPPEIRWLKRGVVAAVWLLAAAVPVALTARNLPVIQATNATAGDLSGFFTKVREELPAQPTVVLSDSPIMLYLLQVAEASDGAKPDYIYLETSPLSSSPDYLQFLDGKYPQYGLAAILTNHPEAKTADYQCIQLLERLSANHGIYYLHPSFGYYFERFYTQPHGLVYRFNLYDTNAWSPPPLTPEQIAQNQNFWNGISDNLESLAAELQPPKLPEKPNLWQRLQRSAHLTQETNGLAPTLGAFYSLALNYWGVELQKSAPPRDESKCRDAAKWFDLAQQLNPNNGPALINLEFNRNQQAGKSPVLKPSEVVTENLGKYAYWYQAINDGGPFDEPNYCLAFAMLLRLGANYRQTIQQLERVENLVPGNITPPLMLAEGYLYIQSHPDVLQYAYPSATQACFDATQAADRALRLDGNNTNALYLKAIAEIQLGRRRLIETNKPDRGYPTPAQSFSNSLAASDQWLRLSPSEPGARLIKALCLMQIEHYDEAAVLWTQLIAAETNNAGMYLNRAISYFHSNQLDAARNDYETAIKSLPDAFQAYYGLGEIAYRQKNYPEAIKNYELYLTNAQAGLKGSEEYKTIEARVQELKAHPPD